MRPQRANHVLREVRLVGVPHEADGNDLRGVHEDASDPDLLPTFALREMKRPKKLHRQERWVRVGLTGQFRRSPMVLAACKSSPNDSRLR